MYKQTAIKPTSLKVNSSKQGESIEDKIKRILNNKEPITDGAPIVYTERKDGVQPQYDIRTDRFEIAVDAMDKVTKTDLAKRENAINERQAKAEGFDSYQSKIAAQNARKEGTGGTNPTTN